MNASPASPRSRSSTPASAPRQLFLETFNRLVNLLDEGSSEAVGPESPGLATAIGVGGVVFARIQEAVAKGELGLGEEEIPQLMYAAVLPYLGAEAAEEELHIPPPPDPSAPKTRSGQLGAQGRRLATAQASSGPTKGARVM